MAHAWMPGAKRIRAGTDGGPLKGGAPRVVWMTLGTAPRQVEWLVGMPHGTERILDILAEGSSLRITQREDIVGFMAQNHHSVDRLLDALRRKASETPAT